MPDLLAIDSTSALCQVALLSNGRYSSLRSDDRRQHAQKLLPMITELLQKADLAATELDTIAVVVGPGSFTGLRIGIGVAQGLAYAVDIPIVSVSSLAALAMSAVIQTQATSILVCTQAREGEVYFAAYRQSNTVGVELVGSEQLVLIDEMTIAVSSNLNEQWTAVGDGWCYFEQLQQGLGLTNLKPIPGVSSDTEAVCQLASLAFAQGLALMPEQVQPNYVKTQMDYRELE